MIFAFWIGSSGLWNFVVWVRGLCFVRLWLTRSVQLVANSGGSRTRSQSWCPSRDATGLQYDPGGETTSICRCCLRVEKIGMRFPDCALTAILSNVSVRGSIGKADDPLRKAAVPVVATALGAGAPLVGDDRLRRA